MAENDERFETESLAETTTSFSQLLFGDGDGSLGRVGVDQIFGDVVKEPRMLCFGDFAAVNDKGEAVLFSETTTATAAKSSVTCSDSSSSASSSTNNSVGSISKSNTRKRGGGGGGPVKETVQCTSTVTDRRLVTNASKKTKSENPNAIVPFKRKEKLGERIAALQQLVSPFGKSDTASVLHEAMGYIKFLQEQVQVLCSPYLQRFSNSISPSEKEEIESNCAEIRKDLRSRGLCLVPTECTEQLVNDNGADLWSPSMAGAIQ